MTRGGRIWTPSLAGLFSGPLLLLRVALIAALLAGFVRTFLLQAVRIPSPSMTPTLEVGDHILINRFLYGPSHYDWERRWLPLRSVRAGDVVAFRSPKNQGQALVKRCVATGGQTVALDAKQLLVDDHPVDESAYKHHSDPRIYRDTPFLEDIFRRRDHLTSHPVPEGHFFALGDHRDLSHDSRFWGSVPEDHLIGRLVLVYWRPSPSSSHRPIPRWVR